MRIIGGDWRGRALRAPAGSATRPTSDRLRQALFDMLAHASWGGAAILRGARVADVFAGTGALGLEALSRGATHASFIERDRDALVSLRANVAAFGAQASATVLPADATAPPRADAACRLVFIDAPYGLGLTARALAALAARGWVCGDALILAEIGRNEVPPVKAEALLADRVHGAGRLVVFRPCEAQGGGV